MTQTYIKSKSEIESILDKKNNFYTGSRINQETTIEFEDKINFNDNYNKSDNKDMFNKGIVQIYLEILSNAIDNKNRDINKEYYKEQTYIDINITDDIIEIKNNGVIIPILDDGKDISLAFGSLRTSGNYTENTKTIGLYGLGSKLANIFSKEFTVEIIDTYNKKSFIQTWYDHMTKIDKAVIKENNKSNNTKNKFNKKENNKSNKTNKPNLNNLNNYDNSYNSDNSLEGFSNIEFLDKSKLDSTTSIRYLIDFDLFFKDDNYTKLKEYNLLDYEIMRYHALNASLYTDLTIYFKCTINNKDNHKTVIYNDKFNNISLDKYIKYYDLEALNNKEEYYKFKIFNNNDDDIYNTSELFFIRSYDLKKKYISLVNNIYVQQGKHIDFWYNQIYSLYLEITKKDIKKQDFEKNIIIILYYKCTSPSFTEAYKATLNKPIPKVLSEDNLSKLKQIVKKMSKWIVLKEKNIKIDINVEKVKKLNIKRHEAINGYPLNRGILNICEGLSASSFVHWGIIKDKGRDNHGLFIGKGKILNILKSKDKKIMENEIISELISVLNIHKNIDYTIKENKETLSYKSILFNFDADSDGNHILGLYITFFSVYNKTLLLIPDFLQINSTPLISVTKNNSNKKLWFYSNKEFEEYCNKSNLSNKSTSNSKHKSDLLDSLDKFNLDKNNKIQRYKGLGTYEKHDAEEVFGKKILKIVFTKTSDSVIKLMYGDIDKNFVYTIKENIPNNLTNKNKYTDSLDNSNLLDVNKNLTSFNKEKLDNKLTKTGLLDSNSNKPNFDSDLEINLRNSDLEINLRDRKDMSNYYLEYIQNKKDINYSEYKVTIDDIIFILVSEFQNENNIRTIPSLIDGFKESQRKIIYTAMKNKKIKVADLAAKITPETNYHHGEVSAADTIIKMAQNFVSSNNIALLKPKGNFGSRKNLGEDAASSRYIYTKTNKIINYLFRKEDNIILKNNISEGKQVEYEYYLPIIPFILINGILGIGFGFSSNIPAYNPYNLIEFIYKYLSNKPNSNKSIDKLSLLKHPSTELSELSELHSSKKDSEILLNNKLTSSKYSKLDLSKPGLLSNNLGIQLTFKYLPYYHGFKGIIFKEKDKYYSQGIYENNIIKEIPITTSYFDYEEYLKELTGIVEKNQDKIKKEDILLKSYKVILNKNDTQFKIEVKKGIENNLNSSSSKKIIDTNLEFYIEDELDLIKPIKQHLVCFNTKGLITQYKDISSMIFEWVQFRYEKYEIRKKITIEHLNKEFKIKSDVSSFISDVVYKKFTLDKKEKQDYIKYFETQEYHLDSYNLIFDIKTLNYTIEKVNKLTNEMNKLSKEIEYYTNTDIKDIWINELKELSENLDIYYNKLNKYN